MEQDAPNRKSKWNPPWRTRENRIHELTLQGVENPALVADKESDKVAREEYNRERDSNWLGEEAARHAEELGNPD